MDAAVTPGPTPDADPVGVIEAALVRLVDDVGVLAEEDVVRAFSILKATDLPSYLRLRHAAKKANRDCSVTVLDKLVRDELPGNDDDASALDELVALARAQCQLHHDADRNAVAVIPMPSRREVWRVYSSGFEDWLRVAYWRAKEIGVPETTMKSALATLAAAGINDGDEIEVHVRAARCDDGYLIDLADEQWQAIHVTPQGWRVVNESPVYFTRTPSMRPLPMPVPMGATHGDVGLLWQHTNIPAHSRVMVLAWLLDCFRPDTPFPVLELVGEQGSAKSTTQSVLRSLVDPNKVMLRGRPKTVEDVFVAAANNWLVSYENLSGLTPEQQDAFCTLATGGGFASRQLYTNGEEHVMETKRPVVLNGIAVVATRPDLIDRVIHVDLPTIPADARRDDADTHAGWERDQPTVFAGLLDLFSAALAILPTVKLTQKQRMADYERLGEAVARALGFAAGEFQQQYAELVRAGIDRALESNAVAQALDKYLADRSLPINWQGTAGQLYDLLNTHSIPDRSSWPRSPKGLSDQLRRIAIRGGRARCPATDRPRKGVTSYHPGYRPAPCRVTTQGAFDEPHDRTPSQRCRPPRARQALAALQPRSRAARARLVCQRPAAGLDSHPQPRKLP
jgi:ubiquitin